MRQKSKNINQGYNPSDFIDRYQSDLSPHNQPINSPSPDKRSSNIIVSTKSPQIQEMKHLQRIDRQYASCSCHQQKETQREKPFTISTPSKPHHHSTVYTIEETEPNTNEGREMGSQSNSRIRNTRIEIVAENTPEDFQSRHNISRIREMNRSDSMELDYIKLLKSKEETIRELKDIIDMIKKNNTSVDEIDDDQRLRDLNDRNGELVSEVKELKIENQHLLNAIERGKKGQGQSPHIKEEIMQREIRELKDSLRIKETELMDVSSAYQKKLSQQQTQLTKIENQNISLLRLLKEKEESLANSSLSVRSSDKDKLSLIKIKDQYNENLKLMRDNFHNSLQETEAAYHSQFEDLHNRIDDLNSKVVHLEHTKSHLPRDTQRLDVREEYHKQKLRHQEIESLMLEKYSRYQNQFNQQKRNNDRLVQEFAKASRSVDEACQRNIQLQDQLEQLKLQNSRLQKSPHQQISVLLQEKQDLMQKSNSLEIDNVSLRSQFDQFARNKNSEISELERKIEALIKDYQQVQKQKKDALENTVGKLHEEIQRSDSKEKEIVDYYEKDKIDTEQKVKMAIDLYNKENQTLKAAITHKNGQLNHLSQEFERLRQAHSHCSSISQSELNKIAQECQDLRNSCLNLEGEATKMASELINLNKILKDKDGHIIHLQNTINAIQHQRDQIHKKVNEVQINNNDLTVRSSKKELQSIELQKKIELLERDLTINSQNYNQIINDHRRDIGQLQQHNQQLGVQLQEKHQDVQNKNNQITKLSQDIKVQFQRRISQSEPIEEDLQELKRAVCDCFVKISNNSDKQIIEEFYKLNYNYELKLEQNLRYLKDLDQMKTQLAEQERQKEILSQKVALLEQNNQIYQRQLKERRILYDHLLQEKSKVERQILMNKKIRVEQSQIDNHHQTSLSEITTRIDRLLDLQRQRNQQVRSTMEVRRVSPERH